MESLWRGLGLCAALGLPSAGQEALWALRAARFSARRRRFGGHLGLQKRLLEVKFRFLCVSKRLIAVWIPQLQKNAKNVDDLGNPSGAKNGHSVREGCIFWYWTDMQK